MNLLIEELYDALKDAGVPDDKARAAAHAVAGADLVREIRAELKEIRARQELQIAAIHDVSSDVRVLKWMLPFLLAMVVAIMFRVFSR